jgi:hypothetical protein
MNPATNFTGKHLVIPKDVLSSFDYYSTEDKNTENDDIICHHVYQTYIVDVLHKNNPIFRPSRWKLLRFTEAIRELTLINNSRVAVSSIINRRVIILNNHDKLC